MSTQFVSSSGRIYPPAYAGSAVKPAVTHNVEIKVSDPLDHLAPAILHEPCMYDPQTARNSAVILVSGAGGGMSGPAGIYPSLADKLVSLLHIPCIRLDYRRPARNPFCTPDILACMSYLSLEFNISRFILVGWSFGGAPCFTVAAREPRRIVGVATVASQTAETDGIKKLAPRPLLLMHGTGDACLSPRCAHHLFRAYGEHGNREIKFFDGDNHGLTKNAAEVERVLVEFSARCLGLKLVANDEREAGRDLVGSETKRVKAMQKGRDLEGGHYL